MSTYNLDIALHTNLPLTELLKVAEQQGVITALDRHFAIELCELSNEPNELLQLLLTLLSKQLSSQHSCLPLQHIEFANPLGLRPQATITEDAPAPYCAIACQSDVATAPQQLATLLAQSSLVWCPNLGEEEDPLNRPLVLEQQRLYLRRYWRYEKSVADRLLSLATDSDIAVQLDGEPRFMQQVSALLDGLFPNHATDIDWQKIAAATTLSRNLSVITGGPGTGKTTTVTKVLLLLMHLQPALRLRLVAPTGKAAARLSESIKGSKARLQAELTGELESLLPALHAIPEEAATIHRLLGVIPDDSRFRHHQNNPLVLDLLIVDEASMVDLPLMAKLLDALPEKARLILLGDQDQLASVEAGAVLADICHGLRDGHQWRMQYSHQQSSRLSQLCGVKIPAGTRSEPLGDSLCMLRHSHRFKDDAGIGVLAAAVNNGTVNKAKEVWAKQYPELTWFEQQSSITAERALLKHCVEQYRPYLALAQQQAEPHQVLRAYNQFRVLSAMRTGEYGVDGLNLIITRQLAQAKLIVPSQEFYSGRPIIIRSNDYNLGLFNGDIGIILQDPSNQRLMAWFERADGSMMKVLPARLPSHDSCFAMTVHKSQGSEFAAVTMILPPNPRGAQMQLLCRELLYTAITRAKTHFSCSGTEPVFNLAVKQLTLRASGLASRLWSSH
ncbi:exodeoxyribonuclease V subunit alpha [Shewanella avicenniae]|uniref:RecBCD enzyme subunit RecD n=1 Tax=Shewanella avicenniae TaxID=2814294 RepID=A0ABX7QWW8_9GAMM|nr:exodeoxyribonuclease V subunit alpha [Shewanella avicenniae]QSX35323.1 exodeoxyribonuclease V subunit alpha [Shewanella avicenniae]